MSNNNLLEESSKPDSSTIKPQSVKKNFGFQTIYQIITLLIPIFTAPFLTRTLQDTALGSYSYVTSYAFYFLVFAMLGIDNHGSRAIAENRDDSTQLRKTFWGIFTDHIISSLIAIGAYLIFAFLMKEDRNLFLINIVYVASALFDIAWLFKGLENFKTVTIKNLIIKVIGTILIFVFIRKPEDIYLYTWIMVGTSLLSNLALFPWVLKYIKPIKLTIGDCTKHIKPLLILFAAYAAFSLYTMFDKTLLGLMATKEDVAYYTYASKINDIPRTFINVITIVLLPRISALVCQKDFNQIRRNINISLEFVTLFGMGTLFGLLAIGQELAIIYLGDSFAESGEMLLWMSPLSYIYVMGSIARDEFLIPMNRDRGYTISMIIAAIINISLSALLIHYFGPIGAVIGTIIAESIATLIEIWLSREVISLKRVAFTLIPYAICGASMYGLLALINHFWSEYSIVHLISFILVGAIIYLLLACLYLFLLSPEKEYAKSFLKARLFRKNKKS
jgi:O-antigen/teichoic acid export membrane protein